MVDRTRHNQVPPPPPPFRPVPVYDVEPADPPPPPVVRDAIPVGPPPLPPHSRQRALDVELVEQPTRPALDVELVEGPWYVGGAGSILWHLVCFVLRVIEWTFGAAVLTIGLAILAAVPLLNFLSLGYLLEAGARIARTGRFRDGFIGVRQAAWLGGVVVIAYVLLLPVRLVSNLAQTAHVIDPGGQAARNWRIGLMVLIVFVFALTCLLSYFFVHAAASRTRGGKFRLELWHGGLYAGIRDAVWDAVLGLRLPYYFWLGFRGFLAALAWLAVPVTMLVLSHVNTPISPIVGWAGAVALALVLLYLPFLQMRLATENRLAAGFDLVAVRAEYRRAPWLFTLSFVVTLLTALPLYLLKIEAAPSEAAWLPSLLFVTFIFPARLLQGAALGRARRRKEEAHWFFRWSGRLLQPPVALFYVLIVFFTQFTSWNGVWSLYEQHAFLLPVPFFGS